MNTVKIKNRFYLKHYKQNCRQSLINLNRERALMRQSEKDKHPKIKWQRRRETKFTEEETQMANKDI